MKTCSQCKKSFDLSFYYFDRSKSDLHRPNCKACERVRNRNSFLKSRYGLTQEIYDEIAKKQNFLCKICEKVEKLVVDHCHKTGKIRDLLCQNCNAAIGMVKEDMGIVLRLGAYLSSHNNYIFERLA